MSKTEYKSRVYTDRPDYADFDAPAKFQAISAIIARRLREHPNAICSYSGGADSDIMIDLIWTWEHGGHDLTSAALYALWLGGYDIVYIVTGVREA